MSLYAALFLASYDRSINYIQGVILISGYSSQSHRVHLSNVPKLYTSNNMRISHLQRIPRTRGQRYKLFRLKRSGLAYERKRAPDLGVLEVAYFLPQVLFSGGLVICFEPRIRAEMIYRQLLSGLFRSVRFPVFVFVFLLIPRPPSLSIQRRFLKTDWPTNGDLNLLGVAEASRCRRTPCLPVEVG